MTSLADIQAALERIRDSIYLSPAPQSETLSRATSNALCLKLENLQAAGSFKERGRRDHHRYHHRNARPQHVDQLLGKLNAAGYPSSA